MPIFQRVLEKLKRYLAVLLDAARARMRAVLVFAFIVAPALGLLAWMTWLTCASGNTGFGGKTLWDWMELLLVPAALGVGIWWLNRAEKANERRIATDRMRESALQAYFDTMTGLLLERDLGVARSDRKTDNGGNVASIARTRTLSILGTLGDRKKRQVLQFLRESRLITDPPVVDLSQADLEGADLRAVLLEQSVLSEAYLREANLEQARLRGAILRHADLRWAVLKKADLSDSDLRNANAANADFRGAVLSEVLMGGSYLFCADLRDSVLRGADLRDATLSRADLRNANLEDADLRRANLRGAKVSGDQLGKARELEGATMPDGTVYRAKD
jgi:uncharacterized protein YjbI with pentapeptide repeats